MSRTYRARRDRDQDFEREVELASSPFQRANIAIQRNRDRDFSPPMSGFDFEQQRTPRGRDYVDTAYSAFSAFGRERESPIQPLRSPTFERRNSRDQEFYYRREMKLEKARNRMRYEAYRYPRNLKEYLQPIVQNPQAMEHAAETFMKLDEDPRYLARSARAFLDSIGAVPDELDDGSESDVTEGESTDLDYGDSDEEGDDDDDKDIGGGGDYGSSSADGYRRPGRVEEGRRMAADPPGFMQWSGYHPYALSRAPDAVGDRRKSFLTMAQTVAVGLATPVGSVSTKGLLGVLVRVLLPKDYRAYFRAAARVLLLTDSVPRRRRPEEAVLEAYERDLLGTAKFLGSGSMMTCLTYSDNHDCGTITLFKLDMAQQREGEWPSRIRPVATMTDVPKRLLKKTEKSVPRSCRTVLQVKSSSLQPLKWVSYTSDTTPGLGFSPNVGRSTMSPSIREALGIEYEDLKIAPSTTANIVCAPIPAMLAWLHVKAAYLTSVELDGTEFQRGGSKTRRIVRWKSGPAVVEHEGKDPYIVVLHPDEGDWVTAPVYWTEVKE